MHLAMHPPELARWVGWRTTARLRGKPYYFSRITCPCCGRRGLDQMPGNASVRFYHCPKCGIMARPKPRTCCVYCSYGTVPCPWRQRYGALEGP